VPSRDITVYVESTLGHNFDSPMYDLATTTAFGEHMAPIRIMHMKSSSFGGVCFDKKNEPSYRELSHFEVTEAKSISKSDL
jgi:hypothetical protein